MFSKSHSPQILLGVSLLLALGVKTYAEDIPNIIVYGQQHTVREIDALDVNIAAPDTTELMRKIPGANINQNGPISGIPQYRGMFGSRVNVTIDGAQTNAVGPNWMDAPLSYAPAGLLESVSVHRGIAAVSSGLESIGGTVIAKLVEGRFSESDELAWHGNLQSGAQSAYSGYQGSVVSVLSNNQHRFRFSVLTEAGDDAEFSGGTIESSEYKRSRGDAGYDYRWRTGGFSHQFGFALGHNETDDAGNAALPMDIAFIDSDNYSVNYRLKSAGYKVAAMFYGNDAEHLMTNHHLRDNNDVARYRDNLAEGSNLGFKLKTTIYTDNGDWTVGVDGHLAEHDSNISNPNNSAFFVRNFNGVERNLIGLFVEREQLLSAGLSINLGARLNRVAMDADEVDASMATMMMDMGGAMDMGTSMDSDMDNGMDMGAMDMDASTDMGDSMEMSDPAMVMGGAAAMNPTAMLRSNFNNADRSQEDNNVDWTIKLAQTISDDWQLILGLARKTRSPSYQERYLWLPMQATAGLADGHNHVGNIDLDPEIAHKLELGTEFRNEDTLFSPRLFYWDIKDYIQGVPATDDAVLTVSTMMGGDSKPLMFSNVEAKYVGFDLEWRQLLTMNWSLSGLVNYVRAERKDIDDDLYRIAPPNASIALTYQRPDWSTALETVVYSKQDNVSKTNDEAKTAGYGLLNASAQYQFTPAIQLIGGISNITDKDYSSHLSGYNRVLNDDIALNARLPGLERTYYFRLKWGW